ncbi:MAG: type VI secretion system baseplate subunit TssG, partial [Pseudomonadota bacterium]
MGRDPRPAPDGVAKFDRLAQDAERFHLLHALRVLEAHFEDTGRLGETRRPREDRVRLGQVPELAFPRATIAAFKPGTAGRPARLTNRFFGLWGPHGPLPLHLTDYARARSRNHRDPTLVAFADLFTHRMLSLFYRAWTSGEPAPSFDRPGQDPFAASVAALTGLRGAPFAERDAMPDLAKRFFAGHLANGPKHAAGLVAMLRGFFGASVRLQPFEGSWLTL